MINTLKQLVGNRSGNFAVVVGIMALPLAVAAGLAIDIAGARQTKVVNQDALDAAVLAASRETTSGQAKILALKVYEENGGLGTINDFQFEKTAAEDRVSASATFDRPNDFGALLRMDVSHIAVQSEARAKAELTALGIRPLGASGAFTKYITLHAVDAAGKDTELGRIDYIYDKTNPSLPGTVTSNFNMSKPVSIQNAKSVYFKMEIDPTKSDYVENIVQIQMSTDDPATSYFLFVDGKQMTKGTTVNLADIVPCGDKAEFAWEDGGNFSHQDFFFEVEGTCSVGASSAIRLVR